MKTVSFHNDKYGKEIEVTEQTYWNQFPKPFGRRLQRKQWKKGKGKIYQNYF